MMVNMVWSRSKSPRRISDGIRYRGHLEEYLKASLCGERLGRGAIFQEAWGRVGCVGIS